MESKSLKKIWILAGLCVIAAIVSLYISQNQIWQSLHGKKLFQSDWQNIEKIIIQFPHSTISLNMDENLWRVTEADNYYADPQKIKEFQEALQTAQQGNVQSNIEISSSEWIKIKLFDSKKQIIDEIKIAENKESHVFYIQLPKHKEIYQTNWKMNLPSQPESWTYQPILALNGRDISRIEKNGVILSRNEEGASFYNMQTKLPYSRFDYMRMFDLLADLHYGKVLSSQEFEVGQSFYHQQLGISTFDGLVVNLDIYTDYQEYWVKIMMSTTHLPSKQVAQEVKANQFLYKDWWFKLDSSIGRFLWMFKL